MKVIAFVDPWGAMGKDADEEYEQIKLDLQKILQCEIELEKDIPPHALDNRSFAAYVFDYGGMLPGCGDLINSFYRCIHDAVIDHPNSLFIIWSSYTGREYKNYIKYELEKEADAPNLVIFAGGNWEDLQQWFGVDPLPPKEAQQADTGGI